MDKTSPLKLIVLISLMEREIPSVAWISGVRQILTAVVILIVYLQPELVCLMPI